MLQDGAAAAAEDGDAAAVAEKLDDLQGALVHSFTSACLNCRVVCVVHTSFRGTKFDHLLLQLGKTVIC